MLSTFLCLILLTAHTGPFTGVSECRKLDEVPDLPCEDVQTRLDAYGVSLDDEPESRAYIVFYEGKYWQEQAPRRGEAFAEVAGYKDYLVNVRRIRAERIVLINGGYREHFTAQFYVCAGRAPLSPATPTLAEKVVTYRSGRISRERYRWCCGCL